ncbi:hypothetical protein K0F45_08875 [Bacteroides ovatus]|uniref:hypothetical protein n=1 Tax=Bacteroides ovatus TaxID=28116 RepID=UPI001F338511|nr:hypothetical protein [Bacteroides ovatus]MCE8977227.1 hypothetical protein [Bacteroides ovatus]
MGAIGLNPIRLDRIGLDPIRINAIKLGVPGASSGSDRPYIDPEVLASLKAVCICYGKSNDDPDRAVVKNLVDPDNPFVISNAAYTEGSGYADKGSPYYGAFVTDGIDDLITSTKTVQEMLGGSNEITVVSLITHISGTGKYNIIGDGGIQVSDYSGQTFMAGTSSSGEKIVELGDKEKLQAVQYTTFDSKLTIGLEDSSYAYYGTFVFNKENVPVDWIHQVIAYFNLDRTLKPDILCNTIKQGITNENHAEFGDKLIDYSGNGRDIQLNNIAWDGDSGIGKYNYPNWKVNVTQGNKYARIVYYDSINGTYSANFKGITDLYKSYGLSVEITVNRANTVDFHSIKEDGIYTMTPPDDTTSIDIRFGGENVYNASCDITITQIPSHAGALCLDGVDDFGKVTGMPIYKDYTVVTDREIFANTGAILSKNNPGAFVETDGNSVYSFGQGTSGLNFISTRSISYLSKYSYCGQSITAGAAEDSTDMWLGTIRDGDSRFFNGAIYSLMSFPYSMSEFLIERQLKKHKLGTLYPDMVEFRPIVKSNLPYSSISYSVNPGEYISVDSMVTITVTLPNTSDKLMEVSCNAISDISISGDNGVYEITGKIVKSPQKIDITIDEYIRFEDIVQPYPLFFEFTDENGNLISWGGKAKVGSTITRTKGVNYANLLEGLFTITNQRLNGVLLSSFQHVVEKSMVFTCTATWTFDNNEPKVILSPRLLRIPNSSYKILGYIPDISGNGNNGVIHNSAYAEGSGVNEDGSYQFDGVDDFVTIPTLSSGGKQVLMKVNWNKAGMMYDQRTGLNSSFAIYSLDIANYVAYNRFVRNGNTYIDGVLNQNILCGELKGITHNIICTNGEFPSQSPIIGSNFEHKQDFSKMALYDFMLFDEISTDDKIKELNEYVGIEGNVWEILTQLSNQTLISNETLIKNE